MPTCDNRYSGQPFPPVRAESQRERNVHGHCLPEERLAARAINYNRQGDTQTDRQTPPQRAQTGPGTWSRPDKYKETAGRGAARTAEGGRGKKSIQSNPLRRVCTDCVLVQAGIKTSRQSDARRR